MQVVKIQALIVLPQFLQASWPALPRRERWPTWIVNMHQTPSRSSSPSSDPPIAFEPGHLDNAMKNLSFLRLLNQIPANSSHQHQYAPAQQGTLWQILPYSFIKDLSFSWWFLETHNLMPNNYPPQYVQQRTQWQPLLRETKARWPPSSTAAEAAWSRGSGQSGWLRSNRKNIALLNSVLRGIINGCPFQSPASQSLHLCETQGKPSLQHCWSGCQSEEQTKKRKNDSGR